MNPMYYPMVIILSFVTPLFALAFWLIRGIEKSEVEKRPAGFVTPTPESRSRSAE
jgi:hypothetical protein